MSDRIYEIEFKEDGSAKVKSGIIGIGSAADKSSASIDKLITKIKKLNSMIGTSKGAGQVTVPAINMGLSKQMLAEMASGMNAIQDILKINVNAVDDLNSSMMSLASLTTTINNVTNNTSNTYNRYSTAINNAHSSMQRMSSFIRGQLSKEFQYLGNVVSNTMRRFNIIGQILSGLTVYFSVRNVIEYADAWTKVSNSIKVFTESINVQKKAQKDLLDLTRRSRGDLEGASKLYTRMSLNAERLGKSQAEIAKFTELIGKALAISGATAEETNSIYIQLSQGMSGVAVKSDEFRSVFEENAPRLRKALEDATGKSLAELKDLSSKGLLPVSELFDALISQSAKIDDEFSRTASTFGQVKLIFRNTFIELVGKVNDATGVLTDLSDGLISVADTIRGKIDEISAFFITIKQLFSSIKKEKGTSGVFIEVGRLAGEIFIETVAMGFKSFTTLVVGLGKLLVDTIINRISSEQPKLAKLLNIDTTSIINKLNEVQTKSLVSKAEISDVLSTPTSRKQLALSGDDIAAEYIKEGRLGAEAYKAILSELAEAGKISAAEINAAFAGISFDDVAQQLEDISNESMTNAANKADALFKKFTDKGFSEAFTENLNTIKDPMNEIIGMLDDMIAKYDDMNKKIKQTPKEITGFWKGFGESFDGLINSAEKLGSVVGDQLNSAISKTSNTLAEFAVEGAASFKDLAKSIIKDLISIMYQQMLMKAISGLFPTLAGGAGASAGGGAATAIPMNQFGGQVQAGQPTIVGERRPEIFVPQTAGRIEPYPDAMGGKSQEIRIVNAVDGDAVLRSASMATVEKMVLNVITNNSQTIRGTIA